MHDPKRRSWVRSKTYIVPSVATILVLASVLASGTLLAGSSPVAVGVKGKVTGWEKLLPQTYAEAASDSRLLFTAGLQLGCPALRKNVGLRCGVNKE